MTLSDKLQKLFDNYTYTIGEDICWDIKNYDIDLYLDIHEGGYLSFLDPHRKSRVQDGEYFTSNLRYRVRPSVFLNRFFKDKYTKSEIESFTNAIRAFSIENLTFKLVWGEDIRKSYNNNNYALKDGGSLGDSCMSYEECSDYLDIYVDNPDKIKLLILVDEFGKIHGRSLIWTLDDGRIFMDKPYVLMENSNENLFKDYASKSGYIRKWDLKCGNTLEIFDGSDKKIEFIKIYLGPKDYDYYPYVDTFKWYNPETGYIQNYYSDDFITLNSDGGCYSENKMILDEYKNVYIDKSHFVIVNGRVANRYDCIERNGVWRLRSEYFKKNSLFSLSN
jgi:hypothetical protein